MQAYSAAICAAHLARQFPKVATEQVTKDAIILNRLERSMWRIIEFAKAKKIQEATYLRQMGDLGKKVVPIIEANYPGLKVIPGGDGNKRCMALAGFDNHICPGGIYYIDNRPGVGGL